ncbi:MAG: amidase [Blastocatellia bacterium]
MNRRNFVKATALGTIASVGAVGCRQTDSSTNKASDQAKTNSVAAFELPFELEEATMASLQEGMKSGKYSARLITELYLNRIEALNRSGPALLAIIETNPDALKIADEIDAERKARGPRGALHGIPALLKDNIDTNDRMTTTAGSFALGGSIPTQDSFVAKRLREAGVVILGKANLSEWANFRGDVSSSGWSARGGQCRNPYVLDRSPSGSSSGSGVATSANLCAISIGTETDGSITAPSSHCGLVGIKPTVGLVSRAGIIPIAHSQDTAGPMCRTVTDAAVLLGAITGVDRRDSATAASNGHSSNDYTQFLDPNGLRGARIGVARKFFGFHPAVDRLMESSLDVIKKSGAELIDLPDFFNASQVEESELEVLLYEFKADLNAYLAGLGDKYRTLTLQGLIEFNEKNRDREMQTYGQEIFLKAEKKGPLTDKAYLQALEKNHRLTRAEGIDAAMAKHKLDAIVSPTTGPASAIDQLNGEKYLGSTTTLAAVAGYPHITLPAGFVGELPVGISFFGRAWSERALIKMAFAFEQATKARRPPKFLPTLKLV